MHFAECSAESRNLTSGTIFVGSRWIQLFTRSKDLKDYLIKLSDVGWLMNEYERNMKHLIPWKEFPWLTLKWRWVWTMDRVSWAAPSPIIAQHKETSNFTSLIHFPIISITCGFPFSFLTKLNINQYLWLSFFHTSYPTSYASLL